MKQFSPESALSITNSTTPKPEDAVAGQFPCAQANAGAGQRLSALTIADALHIAGMADWVAAGCGEFAFGVDSADKLVPAMERRESLTHFLSGLSERAVVELDALVDLGRSWHEMDRRGWRDLLDNARTHATDATVSRLAAKAPLGGYIRAGLTKIDVVR